MVERLGVWAERYEGFVRVGMLTLSDAGEERFSYDESYLRASSSVPIYPILPLSARPFGADTTRAAFSSLGPEGPVGRDVRIALRAGREAVVPVLGRLNHETVGALTFTRDDEEPDCVAVEPRTVDEDFLRALSSDSTRTAYETMLASRLSLNGIGCHRSIDAVEPGDFLDFARQMGVSAAQARTSLSDLAESFVPGLYAAADSLEEESAVDAVRLAEAFEADSCARIEVVRRAAT